MRGVVHFLEAFPCRVNVSRLTLVHRYIAAMANNKSTTIWSWAFYDWANSAYPLVITSTIFPIYYNSVTSSNDTDMPHVSNVF